MAMLRQKMKRLAASFLIAALSISMLPSAQANAAKKVKLSVKKVTVTKGKRKKVTLKNAKQAKVKKVKWTIKSKKIASVKKSGKYAAKVTGKKIGKTKLTVRYKVKGKWKTLKCNVIVSEKKEAVTVPTDDATTKPTPTPTVKPTAEPIAVWKEASFENGTDGFKRRGNIAPLTSVEGGHTGNCLYVTERSDTWHGASLDATDTVAKGATYKFSAWVRQDSEETAAIKISAVLEVDDTTTYPAIAEVDCKKGVWTYIEGIYTVPTRFSELLFYFEGPDGTYDFYIDDVSIVQSTEGIKPINPLELESLKDSYSGIFKYFGTCLSYNTSWNNGYQLQQEDTMAVVQKQFNSFTLENELKPEQVMPYTSSTMTVAEAVAAGYYIPEGYTEDTVIKLNFTNVDKSLEAAKKYGIPMRAHVLMWHQQTKPYFFKENYSDSGAKVSKEVMDKRLEFFVYNVMQHVLDKEIELNGEAGSLVYCWDVVNEYIHRDNAPSSTSWMDIYGDMGLEPTYVKAAFQHAYAVLKDYEIEDTVTLFYNDYDEYNCVEEIVKLVSFINEGEEANICGGIGMQSHITNLSPTLEKYGEAVDAFLATGLEVQVTELDIGMDEGCTSEMHAQHYKDIMALLIDKHLNRDKTKNAKGITGVTIWGLFDTLSWRSGSGPLLFGSGFADPKPAFYSVIEAAKEATK